MRRVLAVLLVLVLGVTSALTVIPEAKAFSFVGSLTLNTGENTLQSAVIDPVGGFAYFRASTDPGIIVRIRLSDLTRVDSLTLNTGESGAGPSVIDTAAGFAYFGTGGSPGVIVKVRLSDFTRVGSLTLNGGENIPKSAVIDPAGGFAYFGTASNVIVRIRLSDFTRVDSLTLNSGEGYPFSAVIDPAGGFAYFSTTLGGNSIGGIIVKVRLSDFTRVASLTLNTAAGETSPWASGIDPAGGFAYFSVTTYSSGYINGHIVVKVRLSDFTRVASLTLGSYATGSGVVDSAGGVAYFAGEIIVRIRLSDFTRVDSLAPGVGYLGSAVIDTAAGLAYFGSESSPGIVVKVDVSGSLPPSPDATSTTVGCTPSTVLVNEATSCTATVADTATGPTTPTGTVTFTPGGTCTLAGTGASATCSADITPAATGTLSVSASYGGDTTHQASSGTTTVTVNIRATTTNVVCTPSTVVVNQATSCAATVADTSPGTTSTPAGIVTFTPGGTCTLAGAGVLGVCSVSITPAASGLLAVSASYPGDTIHQANSGSTTVTVAFTTTCGAGSCTIASNSTISNTSFGSNTLQFDATGPANTVGYANVTVPASLVPDIAQIQVTINGAVIPSSQVQTGTVTGGYWVYFTFMFHSTAHVSITLVPPVTTGGLKVTVNDQNGYGVQGATVQITAAPSGQALPAAMMTGSDGTATFNNLSPGTYTFQVSASGFDSKKGSAMVDSGQTASTTVALMPTTPAPTTGALKITVSGSNGALQGATVTVTSGPSGQSLPAAATTGADGSVTFANLAPGAYSYKVAASGYEDKQVTATVTAGQTQASQASLTQVQQSISQPPLDYTLYAGLGVVVLVVLLGVFLALRRRRLTPKSS